MPSTALQGDEDRNTTTYTYDAVGRQIATESAAAAGMAGSFR